MPRRARQAPGGLVYHVLNRANGKLRLFKKPEDFIAFEQVLKEACERIPMRVLDWCLMPNHWHLVLWPERDGDLTAFMRWMTLTHTQRWKHAHAAVGQGHLYQGRFKSFPIEQDSHLLAVLRYVERNPVRSKLVSGAEQWRWGSCHVRQEKAHPMRGVLSGWPMPRPANWLRTVNSVGREEDEARIQVALERNQPLGDEAWVRRMAVKLDLEHTLRSRGRQVGWRKVVTKAGKIR